MFKINIKLPAESGYDAIRRQVPVAYSIRGGRVISKTEPSLTKAYLGEEISVDFKK